MPPDPSDAPPSRLPSVAERPAYGNAKIAERVGRWERFYAGDPEARFLIMVNYPGKEVPGRPLLWPEKKGERIDWILRNYESLLVHVETVHDDSIPCLDHLTGTEIFAEAFGCPVHRSSDLGTGVSADNMPFALPAVHSPSEAAKLATPRLGACTLDYLFEIADATKTRGGADALLRMVDVQSPFDVAALIWDKLDFYTALITAPAAVMELTDKILALLTAFHDEWFRRYGQRFIAHYPSYYMPRGLTLSEDEVGAVSPTVFAQFCLPHLAALSGRYGSMGVHCCADSRHQWNIFAKIPDLRMINIAKDVLIADSLSFFAQKAAMIPMATFQAQGGPADWLKLVPAGGRVVFDLTAQDREAAQRLVEAFREAVAHNR